MAKQLTKRELDLMAVVWEQGSATVGEVLDALSGEITYSTVMTIFRTLENKGHVRHEQEGKAFRFFALTAPEDVGEGALSRLLDKVYQGSRELLVSRLLSSEDVSADELKKIRKQLDERLEEMDQ
jgi:predicted transcriptional regulator